MSEPTDDNPPEWNQEKADLLIGKYVLVGVTHLTFDGQTVTSRNEYHGRLATAEPGIGFSIQCEGKRAGTTFRLPPDLRVFHVAGPGEYALRSTGEVVKNPDLLVTWSIVGGPTS